MFREQCRFQEIKVGQRYTYYNAASIDKKAMQDTT
jgi:hypothetical protein